MTAEEIINKGLYKVAVDMMDDEIREDVHGDLAPCTELEFLTVYMERHFQKYGKEFTI